jgi:hypothetical protein
VTNDNNDFSHLVKDLSSYFSNPKNWNHQIRLYKNVPISHIRISNPNRNPPKGEEYYIQYFQSLPIEKITSLLSILHVALNTNSIFTVEEENELLELPYIASLPNEDIDILKNITSFLRTLVFADEVIENEKFTDPIKASMDEHNVLSIHPGKKRVGVLEYLFLKNKKEYYIDVIFYKSKMADLSYNCDGFLIDKEYTVIKTLHDFSKAYGYKTIGNFFIDIKNMNVAVCRDSMDNYYLNKLTTFSKEKFIKKFPKVIELFIK